MLDQDLLARFAEPERQFSPAPLWWWSGEKVTRERLLWQMRKFVAGGVFNLVIINLAPKGPLVGAAADDPAWFSDDWWERFLDVCEAAEELDMQIWFYDQIGFSGANLQGQITALNPKAAGQAVHEGIVELGPDGCLPPMPGRTPLAVYALKPNDDGGWTRLALDGVRVGGSKSGDSVRVAYVVDTAFDYLSAASVGLLIDYVHGEFDRRAGRWLGTVIAGSFQDELPAANTWTPAFPEAFREMFGYDILDHLPSLWSVQDPADERIRSDYYRLRTALFENAVFKPLHHWHDERNMLLGSDQMNPARAGFPTQGTQLYSDYFRTHRWYSAAGSDHEGDAKVHSSMADLYDHPRVWIESFHSSGWGGTLEDTFDWLLPFFRSGANLYNPHASYYSTVAGWFEWAPPSTDWRQPYFEQYPAFAAAVSRICGLLTWGKHECDVAVLHPSATIQALLPLDLPVDHFGDGQMGTGFAEVDQTQDEYLQIVGSNNWFVGREGVLDHLGIDFDVIDDDSVVRATAEAGALSVSGMQFRTVILPSCDRMETATAQRLLDFLTAGGRLLIVGRKPAMAVGRSGNDSAVRALADHPAAEYLSSPDELLAALAQDHGFISGPGPVMARRQQGSGLAFIPAAHPNASAHPLRTDTWLWDDYDFDPSRYVQSMDVSVAAELSTAELWNPATGSRRPAAFTWNGATTEVAVDFDGAPAVFLVWTEGPFVPPAADSSAVSVPPAIIEALDDGWSGTLVPTLDNHWGDFALPASDDDSALQIWSMDWAESDAGVDAPEQWEPMKATFGEEVLVCGPAVLADAPRAAGPGEIDDILAGRIPLEAGSGTWERRNYSRSRGREKQPESPLGPKGRVPDEFIQTIAPGPGEAVAIRSIVRVPAAGRYELVVGAAASKRLWVNGQSQGVDDGSYFLRASVDLAIENVIEYRLGPSEMVPRMVLRAGPAMLGSFFAIAAPGSWPEYPEFMTSRSGGNAPKTVYSRSFSVPHGVQSATLVTGAASGLTVFLDGKQVARQEKVEYYESEWGANPMFFQHNLTGLLSAGEHQLVLVADTSDPRNGVYADLAMLLAGSNEWISVQSGPGWVTREDNAPVVLQRSRSVELASAHAAARPHPLPRAHWLNLAPRLGSEAVPFEATAHKDAKTQMFRFMLPAGTRRISLPLVHESSVTVAGIEREYKDGTVDLAEPLTCPAEVLVRTSATRFAVAGSAWEGPAVVETVPAPIAIGSWRHQGLASWSGGVAYSREVRAAGGEHIVLDLGRVRGSVRVEVNGAMEAEAFCEPFRFDLSSALRLGANKVTVTVYNTLAPYLDAASPTIWTFPSQLESGILGPVTLQRRTGRDTQAESGSKEGHRL